MKSWLRAQEKDGRGWILTLWVQPRASKTEVCGVHHLPDGEALKLRVAAPPVEGAANDEILRFLKKKVGGPGVQVEILRGAAGRKKEVVLVTPGLDAESIRAKLIGLDFK